MDYLILAFYIMDTKSLLIFPLLVSILVIAFYLIFFIPFGIDPLNSKYEYKNLSDYNFKDIVLGLIIWVGVIGAVFLIKYGLEFKNSREFKEYTYFKKHHGVDIDEFIATHKYQSSNRNVVRLSPFTNSSDSTVTGQIGVTRATPKIQSNPQRQPNNQPSVQVVKTYVEQPHKWLEPIKFKIHLSNSNRVYLWDSSFGFPVFRDANRGDRVHSVRYGAGIIQNKSKSNVLIRFNNNLFLQCDLSGFQQCN